MSNRIKITVPIMPKGQARDRIGKRGNFARSFKDPKQAKYEAILAQYLRGHVPDLPIDGPLGLGLKAFFPIPKSWSKKKQDQARAGILRPTSKPDLSNLAKNVEDVMQTMCFFGDDSQIVDYLPGTGKYYSDRPRWEITLEKLVPTASDQGGLLS